MSGFWEDNYETGGGSSDAYVPDMTADEYGGMPSADDVSASVRMAMTNSWDDPTADRVGDGAPAGKSDWWDIFAPTDELKAPASEYAKRQGVGETTQPKEEPKGLLGRIEDFANKNKSLTEMLLKGVAGAATAKNASKAATAQMREKDQIERERNKQYSDSIAALAKPGIIGRAQPLKRTNGTQVFNNGRIA